MEIKNSKINIKDTVELVAPTVAFKALIVSGLSNKKMVI
jgi:hypothetical protein